MVVRSCAEKLFFQRTKIKKELLAEDVPTHPPCHLDSSRCFYELCMFCGLSHRNESFHNFLAFSCQNVAKNAKRSKTPCNMLRSLALALLPQVYAEYSALLSNQAPQAPA